MKQAIAAMMMALAVPLDVHATTSPIGKVLSMISDLQATIIKEGEVVQKEYAEFAEWCEDRSRNIGFEIKTGQAEVESLTATIAEETATVGSLTTKVEELAASIASNDADLKSATGIRNKEVSDFTAAEKELMETVDTIKRAIGIIERQMKGGASMMQLKNAGNLVQTLKVMVQASMIGTGDAAKLTAFVQEQAQDADDAEAPGAPAAAVYESQGGGIVDTLQDLLDKAESQLADARSQETAARHNYDMLKQSLEDEMRVANQDLSNAKKGIAESSEKKSTAEGDEQAASKQLAEDIKAKGSLHQDCMAKASAFQAETNSRGEELKALAQAKQIIQEATGGAALDQVSLFQLARSSISSGKDLHKYEAVRLVRDMARKQQSSALAQLASRMSAAMHSTGAFEKVKGLISDMISKLEKEAGADATKKAYCDKELAESNTKKADKSDEIEGLSTKIDKMAAKSAQLKEEVAVLESGLSKLAKSQATMDQIRQEEKATYGESNAELEKGLAGIKGALKVLNEYYAKDGKAHEASEGASTGIIGLLEVIEADFSKNLAQINADEESAVAEYEAQSKENEIENTMKGQDVKYKTKESKQLDKTSAELTSDRTGVTAELEAVQEYLSRIEEECIAKAETYQARKERREAELAGLKDALQILESETAFVQRKAVHRMLRGQL
jgi:chromosome segregation ATPase